MPIRFSQSRDSGPIGESLIPGSRRDYRDSGIRDSSVVNPGIKKTGTGLQAYRLQFAIISTARIGLYGKLTFSTAYSALIVVMQSTVQLSPTNRATHWCKYNGVADLKTRPSPMVLPCRIWSFCVKGCRHKYRRTPEIGEP